MGCKFKYNGQTYESEADLKAVLRQELKANTAKVRDGDKQTTQPTTNTTVKSGVEISSNAKGLAAALTNPTELAKYKGNLTQSYPVTFRGKTYIDSEAAYQALKSTATKDNGPNNTYNLMVDIIKTKLEQYPRLVTEIINQGGSAWILNSTHQPTRQNSVWETGGKNWFIKALNDAYIAITSSTTQQPVVDEITIQKMTEIMKEIYPEAVTDQSQSVTTDDKFMAAKMVVDFANGTVDTLPVTYASLYIAWFRNTPLVQAGIKAYGGSEEALVQAIGEQAVVQKGKAWTWWKKFLAWLLNSANELSDLSKTELRNILTDAFLSRQDITATVGKDVYKKDRTSGEWVGVDPDNPIVYPSDAAFKAALDAEQATKVKNDAMIKPAWKNNKRAALENRLLNIHKAIALHPVNAQNLLAPVSTVITKGIVEKLGIRAKHKTRGAVIDPLSNINASIAMVQGKQGVGIVANAINTKAALTGVDAKLTPMYPVQSPLSNDEKHIQLPINLRMLGIEKVEYADGTLAYSLGKLVDTFGNSIIANLSESLTQQVDNVKDPVAVELG